MQEYRTGIDIGSTTVKLVLIDEKNQIIYGDYRRHGANPQKTLADLLSEARKTLGEMKLKVKITGSGSICLSDSLGIGFVQEVVAVASAVKNCAPRTDVAIELGGEDAKIIYFKGGLEERMNGVCAGGTGSFIDQMAALLQTDAAGLDREAGKSTQIYPIAARCGVFAKTDIQPLINDGAARSDIAASVFQAVVNQTVSGLACGKPIRGNVAFLGGPLHYLPELRSAFIRTLKLTDETAILPENSHLFAALGAALESGEAEPALLSDLLEKLEKGVAVTYEMPRLPALFTKEAEYEEFRERHAAHTAAKGTLGTYRGKCFLGIDAGSTTTKAVLIGESGEILFSFYEGNQGDPVRTAIRAMRELREKLPPCAEIVYSCSTGYGEALLKTAFSLDEGEVETIAHTTAASFFDRETDCVLDIGGQDMKCIRLKNGAVDTILLNEACSSGCGSFLDNFAASLGYTASDFAKEALFAKAPVDLGTRCTVFMNSNVKQAQKEGAPVPDIAAGLAYSVIKNALYKVIKLTRAEQLGKHIVVQGGTFLNDSVLRAFEKITETHAVRPDIAGLMGAFGAALIARKRYHGQKTAMLALEEIAELTYETKNTRCGGCQNHCLLTVNTFPGGRKYITGNRCEKGLGKEKTAKKAPDMVSYKRKRIFDYEPLPAEKASRGVIGIPRVLNIYENYPFWATFFGKLGFSVVLSPFSSHAIYEAGMESIPSESECYPAKLSHGHVEWLIAQGVTTVFHPCVYYEHKETPDAKNNYNCPIVISYAENLKNNVEAITDGKIRYLRPFLAFTSEKTVTDRLVGYCEEIWQIPAAETRAAAHEAWNEQRKAKSDIREEGRRLLSEMEKEGGRGIVLAGRPYHIDPEINHGIPGLIASYGLYVFTEDSLPIDFRPERPLRVVDQWVFHSRMYNAAEFVCKRDDLELVQLNSFGCGIDAVTGDQISEILESAGKLYTLLKIDEVANLGAVRIRIRSLMAAMDERRERGIRAKPATIRYRRAEFTKQMKKDGYTILAPQMSPIHFDMLSPVFEKYGYHLVVLENNDRRAVDTGLKYVNNDACYPSILMTGQFMHAVLSGKYDTDRLAIVMTQTGGCCRASNYIGFIRRALKSAGLPHIPVISLNLNGMEKNPGFRIPAGLAIDAVKGIVYGDLMMKCLYRTRPYEKEPGSAEKLHQKWLRICLEELTDRHSKHKYGEVCRGIVRDFDELPLREDLKKPRVGIVGEILVKYQPMANNHLVELLEREGAEAVVPDFLDFFQYSIYGNIYKSKYLGKKKSAALLCETAVKVIERARRPATEALKNSKRFLPPQYIGEIAVNTKPFLSLGNKYGEGWFLAGEMVELLRQDIPNIVCIQPFGCLPNHVVGKGVIKTLKTAYPQANIAAVDYDPGASQVNQLNRIKLMLAAAREKMK